MKIIFRINGIGHEVALGLRGEARYALSYDWDKNRIRIRIVSAVTGDESFVPEQECRKQIKSAKLKLEVPGTDPDGTYEVGHFFGRYDLRLKTPADDATMREHLNEITEIHVTVLHLDDYKTTLAACKSDLQSPKVFFEE